MSKLRVLVITSYGDHTALTGGRLRRDSLVDALGARGHVIDRVNVLARPGPRSAARATGMSVTSGLRGRAQEADIVLLGDVFCLPMMPVLRMIGVPVLVDLVDSPYRLIGSAPRLSLREKISAAIQDAELVPVMQLLLPMADGVTYISEEDVRVDALRVRRLPVAAVVPNGINSRLMDFSLDAPPENGYVAWLADWLYPPNRESLHWFVREVAPSMPDGVLSRVGLFGHGDPWLPTETGGNFDRAVALMTRHGFADDLREVYRNCRVVIAPVTRGAGMNNKVLEPLAAGRALLTTSVGVRGLPNEVRKFVRTADEGPAFSRELEQMLHEPWCPEHVEEARRSVSLMSWSRSGEQMETALLEVQNRRGYRGSSTW